MIPRRETALWRAQIKGRPAQCTGRLESDVICSINEIRIRRALAPSQLGPSDGSATRGHVSGVNANAYSHNDGRPSKAEQFA